MARPFDDASSIPEPIDAIALHEDDQVATALRDLAAGETVRVRRGQTSVAVALVEAIPLCHKLALRPLAPGERIRKYGEVIGEATAPVAAGGHVHVHNLASLRARRRQGSDPA